MMTASRNAPGGGPLGSSGGGAPSASSLTGSLSVHRVRALPEEWKAKLQQAHLNTMQEVFSLTELELMEKLDLHMSEVVTLLQLVAAHALPRPLSAFELREKEKSDDGLPVCFVMDERAPSTRINRGITELVGPPGLGKTQWCFGLCARAALPVSLGGLAGGTCWIDTEGAFSTDRLVELAQFRYPEHFNTRERVRTFVQSVHLLPLAGTQEPHKQLLSTLTSLEPLIVEKGFKLLVVDGIAATLRTQTDRTEILGQIASSLKLLSDALGIAVVVTNQVTTKFVKQNQGGTDGNAGTRSDAQLVAALGVGWAHAVNTRFLLEMASGSVGDMETGVRTLRVAKSPMFPCETFSYVIGQDGATILEKQVPSGNAAGGGGSVLSMTMHNTHHMTVGTRLTQQQA